MNRFLLTTALGLVVLCSTAHAGDPRLLIPIAFDASAEVPDAVRSECGVDFKLQEEAARQLRGRDKSWEPTDTPDGRVVRLTILKVQAGAVGAMTGAKSLDVRVDLLDDGKLERSTELHGEAFSVPLLTFKSTCTILDKATRVVARRVAEWVRNPGKALKGDLDAHDAATTTPMAQASAASR